MERKWLQKQFKMIGSRVTIRKGTSFRGDPIRLNVTTDSKGEHFTLTIDPEANEKDIDIQVLDVDDNIRQMLMLIKYPKTKLVERLLVGHDEMHWFVAGVTTSKNIKEAFERLRPAAVTLAMKKAGVKTKDQMKRKNKGFIRQGEWFFVPVHYKVSEGTIIHKNEPISRRGGTPHYVEELVRTGGRVVFMRAGELISESQFANLPERLKPGFTQRIFGAKVLARGKVKHRDHHTIELKGWHEVHLATEAGVSTNAFID